MSESYIYKAETNNIPYLSLPHILKDIAVERPDQEAVVFYLPSGERYSITYSELYCKAELFGKGLYSLGFERNSIVAISSINCQEWLICTFGTQMAGLIPLHFTFWNPSGEDVVDILNEVGKCVAMIVDFSDLHNCKLLREKNESGKDEIFYKITTLKTMVVMNSSDKKYITIENIYQVGRTIECDLPNISPDDICGIFMTSGSSGGPKAVPHTHRSAYKSGYNLGKALEVLPGEQFYDAKPFSWLGSYPSAVLSTRGTRITASDVMSMKSVDEINNFTIEVFSKEKCVSAFLQATCILDLANQNMKEFKLRCVCTGGQPIDGESAKVIHRIATHFSVVYGTTETGNICMSSVNKAEEYDSYEVGFPVEGTEVKIVDASECVVGLGTSGEVYVRARDRFLCYLNAKEQYGLRCDANGWYKTADIGYMKPNRSLIVTGRKSDTMIIGDDLVSPSYLEGILKRHKSVRNAYIYPVHRKQTFQEACAAILLKDGSSVTGEELKDFFRSQIAKYSTGFLANLHIPKTFLFFSSFPSTHSGKLDRCALKVAIAKRLDLLGTHNYPYEAKI